jgi:hypothetical protein
MPLSVNLHSPFNKLTNLIKRQALLDTKTGIEFGSSTIPAFFLHLGILVTRLSDGFLAHPRG